MSEKSLFFQGGLQQVINLSLAVVPNQEWGQSPPAFHPVAFRNVWRPFLWGLITMHCWRYSDLGVGSEALRHQQAMWAGAQHNEELPHPNCQE